MSNLSQTHKGFTCAWWVVLKSSRKVLSQHLAKD